MKKISGFSLVELMISLIVISIVTAAFAPIVTKKIKTSDMSIGTGSSDYVFDETICSNSVANCSICVKDECVRCKIGYYLDGDTCKVCSDNCAVCDSQNGCTKCDKGYYLNETNCETCPLGCQECSSSTNCTKCEDMCEICLKNGGCKKCKIGYFWNGRSCTKCSESDSVTVLPHGLTIYKYNLGDECGPHIPTGINVCYYDNCPYSPYSPLCVSANSNNSSFASTVCSINSAYSTYSACHQTLCNWYAANIALELYGLQGWRFINSSDLVGIGNKSGTYLLSADFAVGFSCINDSFRVVGAKASSADFEGISYAMLYYYNTSPAGSGRQGHFWFRNDDVFTFHTESRLYGRQAAFRFVR